MGRSAKEYCRPNQACDYGGPVANADESKIAVANPSGVEVNSATSSGVQRATARQKVKLSDDTKKDLQEQSRTGEAESGWDKIGAAGADMVRTAQARKAAKAKKSGGGTSGVPA